MVTVCSTFTYSRVRIHYSKLQKRITIIECNILALVVTQLADHWMIQVRIKSSTIGTFTIRE